MRFVFILSVLIYTICNSQDIPNQYHFSDDETRLIRGGSESDGFYDASEIKTIYLYFDELDFWDQLHDNFCDKK